MPIRPGLGSQVKPVIPRRREAASLRNPAQFTNSLPEIDTSLRNPAQFINSLPEIDASSLDTHAQSCSLCSTDYRRAGRATRSQASLEQAVRLPCQHIFGAQCLEEWLSEHPYCPHCHTEFSDPPRLLEHERHYGAHPDEPNGRRWEGN